MLELGMKFKKKHTMLKLKQKLMLILILKEEKKAINEADKNHFKLLNMLYTVKQWKI